MNVSSPCVAADWPIMVTEAYTSLHINRAMPSESSVHLRSASETPDAEDPRSPPSGVSLRLGGSV